MPIKKSVQFTERTEREASPPKKKRYQGMIGSIIFSMVETRLDIAYATLLISHFTKNLSYQHTEVVKTILKYLKWSKNRGIAYDGEEKLKIESWLDSD